MDADFSHDPAYLPKIIEKADINNLRGVQALFTKYNFDADIHMAAESHVDNSIKNPFIFAQTNIQGVTINPSQTFPFWMINRQ